MPQDHTSSARSQRYAQAMRDAGCIKVAVWVPEREAWRVRRLAESLRAALENCDH
jgi:hypothetical protein